MIAVFCFNLLGDGLRDIVDPQRRTWGMRIISRRSAPSYLAPLAGRGRRALARRV